MSYLLQHEDNTPGLRFPLYKWRTLCAPNATLLLLALTKEDHEETLVNIGTLRLDHRFNDIFNLRNTFRYSHVDRDLAVTNATVVLPNYDSPEAGLQRDTQESSLTMKQI